MDRLNHFYMIFRLGLLAVFVIFVAGNALVATLMSRLKNGKQRVEAKNRGALQNQLAQETK